MSNYTKSVNFAVKDALSTGDPDKKIKGTEIDTEYNNIATAVNSKANTASPALTGTPTAPTATAGTATTQLATTAFTNTALLNAVGSTSASSVVITGGTITGITDLAVADGGTGASTAANARVNLGVGSNGTGNKTISVASPSGGSDGDIWYKVA